MQRILQFKFTDSILFLLLSIKLQMQRSFIDLLIY